MGMHLSRTLCLMAGGVNYPGNADGGERHEALTFALRVQETLIGGGTDWIRHSIRADSPSDAC